MAYSDYGGYAYRQGKRVEDRSDSVLSSSGIRSTPGAWPGWTIQEGRSGRSYHVLLGDGPIFVGLHKQSGLSIHRLEEDLATAPLCKTDGVPAFEWKGGLYVDPYKLKNRNEPVVLEVDGNTIEVFWLIEDNLYQYVRLIQPDGTIWLGFSGYGVGAGLEDSGYGFSTSERAEVLFELFLDTTTSSSQQP